MSLILEALNKAEHERSGDNKQATAATYSMSVVDNGRRHILSLILLAVGIAAFALYLSLPFFSSRPASQSSEAHAITHQQAIEQPATAFAPEPIVSTVNVTAKKEQASPHNSTNIDDAMRLKDFASTPEAKNISTDAGTKTTNMVSQDITTTTEKHTQKHAESTLAANFDAATSLDTSAAPQAENEYLDTPILQNLPSSIKAQLPNLELNIHVYSTNPSKSFVYINSTRYREGATVENGIILEKVIPTGAILRHQETLFRLIIET